MQNIKITKKQLFHKVSKIVGKKKAKVIFKREPWSFGCDSLRYSLHDALYRSDNLNHIRLLKLFQAKMTIQQSYILKNNRQQYVVV